MPEKQAKKESAILVTLIAGIAITFAALYFLKLLTVTAVLVVVLALLVFIYSRASQFIVQVKEYERIVVFRFGKFTRLAGPGWVVLVPFIEAYRLVDLRVKTVDVAPQDTVTKDSVKLIIDAILFIKVTNPVKAVLNVVDYEAAAVHYIRAHLRDIIGKVHTEDVISGIEEINKRLQEGLASVAKDWGIEVVKVEMQSVQLPPEVLAAMHEKRAAVDKKHAAVQRAEAQKLTIDAIQAAAGKLTDPALRYLYLQSLERIAEGKSSKIIFPMELSRLAEGLTKTLTGVPYEKAQGDVLQKYKETVKEEAETTGVMEMLRRGLEEKEKRKPAKRKARKFEF